MNAHKRTTWTGLALRGGEWKALFSRYEKILGRRNGVALAICDMVDLGMVVKGPPLRRFRRLDKLVKAYYRRFFSAHVAESLPLGGIDG